MKNNKAVTLVALIITVIILLILAGIVIIMNVGENGIIKRALRAEGKYENDKITMTTDIIKDNKEELDVLIIIEAEDGIKEIKRPDGIIIYGNNKNKVAIDYSIEYGIKYNFEITTSIGDKSSKSIRAYVFNAMLGATEEEKIQEFIATETASYKFYCWGAQGGAGSTIGKPGKGAYTRGEINLSAGEILYICVGEQGEATSNTHRWI